MPRTCCAARVEIAPGLTAARRPIWRWCSAGLGRPAEALELLDEIFDARAGRARPSEPQGGDARAARRLRQAHRALRGGAGASARTSRACWLSYGHMLKTVGRQAEGVAAYRKAIELKPALGEAWWSLANLKTVKFDDADIAAMRAALGAPSLSDDDRFHLDFALGKALHDAGRRDEAFAHYARGQRAAAANASPIDRANISATGRSQHRAVHREVFAERPAGAMRPTRSSSSACRAPDRPWSSRSCRRTAWSKARRSCPTCRRSRARPGTYPDGIVDADRRRAPRAGRGISQARRASSAGPTGRSSSTSCRTTGCSCRSSSWSCRTRRSSTRGAIRSAAASRTSASISRAARTSPTTSTDLGRYYADYVRLMAHVDAVLPGRVHRVIYERMVDDTEAEVRRAARLLRAGVRAGLPRILQDRARGAHRQLGAGAPADLPRRDRRMARLRAASWAAEGGARPGARCLSGRARDLPATVAQQSSVGRPHAVVDKP